MQTKDHHKEGTVVFYEGKSRSYQLFRMRHDHDAASGERPKSEQIIQITKSDAWRQELSAKVVTFFKDMLSRYAKGELTKEEVGQEKASFMARVVMPLRRPTKAQLRKGIAAKPAASDTVVSEAAKPAASDTVLSEAANKRQKVMPLRRPATSPATSPATNSFSEGCIAAKPAANDALFGPDVPPPPDVFSDII